MSPAEYGETDPELHFVELRCPDCDYSLRASPNCTDQRVVHQVKDGVTNHLILLKAMQPDISPET